MTMENNIVLISEDISFLSELSNIIKAFNFKPLLFEKIDEAFKFLESHKPYLVITDLFFKNYQPEIVWSKLKSLQVENILIISDNPDTQIGTKVIQEGALDYLLKPVEVEQIRLLLAKLKIKRKNSLNNFRKIVTNNPKMLMVLKIAENAAKSRSTVLIKGESGVGKELIARMIHEKSSRANEPFIAVNCAALPETLLESELFGHEKGSFTGAISTKPGKFELANNGTILLDEITEMNFPLQAKLLRVLQEREIDRIGGKEPIKLDIRIIATTNRDMKKIIAENKFREDLYYRLNVIPLQIPPLRERKDDIPILAKVFIKKHSQINELKEKGISDSAIKKLEKYDWPGNIRELENIIERAVVICPENIIDENYIIFEDEIETIYEQYDKQLSNESLKHDNSSVNSDESLVVKPGTTIAEMEKKLILETLKSVNDNRTVAAELLGISVRTLRNKLNEYKKVNS